MQFPKEVIEAYFTKIKSDYRRFWGPRIEESHLAKMVHEFESGLSAEFGSKYIKIITGGRNQQSVHSFIVLNDEGKFKRGDILKSASWRAPAKNFARGNVLEGSLDRVTWTGTL